MHTKQGREILDFDPFRIFVSFEIFLLLILTIDSDHNLMITMSIDPWTQNSFARYYAVSFINFCINHQVLLTVSVDGATMASTLENSPTFSCEPASG